MFDRLRLDLDPDVPLGDHPSHPVRALRLLVGQVLQGVVHAHQPRLLLLLNPLMLVSFYTKKLQKALSTLIYLIYNLGDVRRYGLIETLQELCGLIIHTEVQILEIRGRNIRETFGFMLCHFRCYLKQL